MDARPHWRQSRSSTHSRCEPVSRQLSTPRKQPCESVSARLGVQLLGPSAATCMRAQTSYSDVVHCSFYSSAAGIRDAFIFP
eukprot:6183370-Pleurochrysis_carterae.AAC.6